MTDHVIAFCHYNEVRFNVGQSVWSDNRQLNQEFRPSWLRYLRIYELVPALADQEALAVIADALEIGDRSSVDAIIREYGVVGRWRPSTVLVRNLQCYASNRIVADNVVAHALWNTDLHSPCGPNNAYRLDLEIEHAAQREAQCRVFRPVLHFTEMTPEELGQGTPTRGLETRVAQLERAVLFVGDKVRRMTRQSHSPPVKRGRSATPVTDALSSRNDTEDD